MDGSIEARESCGAGLEVSALASLSFRASTMNRQMSTDFYSHVIEHFSDQR